MPKLLDQNLSIASVYKQFNAGTDIVAGTNVATAPLFNGAPSIQKPVTNWYTSSATPVHVNSGSFVACYNGTSTSASHLFDVFFANWSHSGGSGSEAIIYKSLATKILNDPDSSFSIDGSSSVMQVAGYVIPRIHYRDRLDPGNWVITMTASNAGGVGVYRTFVDDSAIYSGTNTQCGLKGNVYSGSIGAPLTAAAYGGIVGNVYYDLGLILLNPSNSLVNSLLASASNNISASYSSLDGINGRSQSKLQSGHYFCRVYNSEYNFSNNPTFADSSNGNLLWTEMIYNPQVFPTTVGLYNDNNECLAVAKLSQPIKKSFVDEIIMQIRLDF